MTCQYIIGEASALLADFRPPGDPELARAARELRRQVETAMWSRLPELVGEALTLADRICWSAVEEGDMITLDEQALAAARLEDFAVAAGLKRDERPDHA